jgi:hypothetical protein
MRPVAFRDFLDVLQIWDARKYVSPAHYYMTCDYFSIPSQLRTNESVELRAANLVALVSPSQQQYSYLLCVYVLG